MTDYYKDKQQLTDEQIVELAPDWATHYHVNENNLCFFNQNNAALVNKSGEYISDIYENEIGIEAGDIPVPEVKPFDIDDYEFSDIFGSHHSSSDGNVYFTAIELGRKVKFSIAKEDAIALSKHFKLTAEDLK